MTPAASLQCTFFLNIPRRYRSTARPHYRDARRPRCRRPRPRPRPRRHGRAPVPCGAA